MIPGLGFLRPGCRNPVARRLYFPSWGKLLHPMGERFIQDSFTKAFKNHTIRLSAGLSTSPHLGFNFTLRVRFSYRIPTRRNQDSCVLAAGFLLLGHGIPGLGPQWPRNSRGRVGWAWLSKSFTTAKVALPRLGRSLRFCGFLKLETPRAITITFLSGVHGVHNFRGIP